MNMDKIKQKIEMQRYENVLTNIQTFTTQTDFTISLSTRKTFSY